ncbi:diguanylate cyclase (GGDEF) domain-containing protein [Pseudomonas linyingensis]|uniref:Diguanylate cyclase (GGDEF) domain-containing protein n=1 Tax=Pseudomonas linyingensis TaxID=915471 RepID=A0A1H6UHV1_9PSED|nr:EAL domain-containing protein [Pseudomonas linyingensis]SEI91276.1 diguanylate cyclase (GGDEF) domain-containing protein [Pseudomonas linyingensis]
MSLLKQLFIAICLFLLAAFTGSFVTSLESSRAQTISQLRSHAQDAATALGLSLTPHVDDPAMVELMVNSIFDSGYYASIRVRRVGDDSIIVERQMTPGNDAVPSWFSSLVDLHPEGGEALIMRGWEQAARVEVVSHPQFALARLWDSSMGSLSWLLLCGLLSAALGGWLLRLQLRPLDDMVQQAQAISRREFISLPQLPRTPELRRVVLAMNQMVEKLRSLFAEAAQHSEHLAREAYQDSLTGLANRRRFDMRLGSQLVAGEQTAAGYLLLLRVNDLAGLNQRLGGTRSDALLCAIGELLQRLSARQGHPDWLAARTRGGEFALIMPGQSSSEADQLATELNAALESLRSTEASDCAPLAHIGLCVFHPGETEQRVLARADQALAQAQNRADKPWERLDSYEGGGDLDQHEWRTWLDDAIGQGKLQLYFQPVVRCADHTVILHHKVLARLLDAQGKAIPAGIFLPWVARFGWMPRLDQLMLEHTLAHLGQHPQPLALSLSSATLNDQVSMALILHTLREHPQAAHLLTLELDERSLPAAEQLLPLCQSIRDTGYALGLQHFGGRFSLIGNLAHLALAYLKIDGSFIRRLDRETDKRVFIDAIRRATHNIDLPLIAEMVEHEGEALALRELGIHGVMGRLIGAPVPRPGHRAASHSGSLPSDSPEEFR